MHLNHGTDSFLSSHRAYLAAAAIIGLALIYFLWNPFKEAPLETEYHSGRDAYTVVPGQLPEPPRDLVTENIAKPASTPQAAAIEAQLAEVQKLTAGSEDRQKRIAELNMLIAKVDAAEGIERDQLQLSTDQRTEQVRQELADLQARTERLQKRIETQSVN